MKTIKNLIVLSIVLSCLFFTSCGDDSGGSNGGGLGSGYPVIETIPIYFAREISAGRHIVEAEYEAVRIGEYLWMNRNFNHDIENPVTQQQLNKCMGVYALDSTHYQVDIEVFNFIYGGFYSRDYIERYHNYYRMLEGDNTLTEENRDKHWGLPSGADFMQLFAMCGDASEANVRHYLSCRADQTPLANSVISYWFNKFNSNVYGFNLMPGGARFHVPTKWNPYVANGEESYDPYKYSADAGDFSGFLMTAQWVTLDPGVVAIHDFPEYKYGKVWAWLNMRWCRRISDSELGYKLYVNSKVTAHVTDIKKLNIDEISPAGYTELPKGYLRGFYVQYILDRTNPLKTVQDIVAMAVARE